MCRIKYVEKVGNRTAGISWPSYLLSILMCVDEVMKRGSDAERDSTLWFLLTAFTQASSRLPEPRSSHADEPHELHQEPSHSDEALPQIPENRTRYIKSRQFSLWGKVLKIMVIQVCSDYCCLVRAFMCIHCLMA